MNSSASIQTSNILERNAHEIGRQVLILYRERYPDQFTGRSEEEYLRHLREFLSCLSVSIRYSSHKLMEDWLSYCSLEASGNPMTSAMDSVLEVLKDVLSKNFEKETFSIVKGYLGSPEGKQHQFVEEAECFLERGNPFSDLARRYTDLLLEGFRREASDLILASADSGLPVKEIYRYVFQPSQLEIGRLWQRNKISPAMEHYFSAATQLIMSLLYGRIFSAERIGKRILAASVANELHEIGVRMVSDFFEMEGWDTLYLGAGTPTDSILKMAEQRAVSLLCISATIAVNLPEVENVIQAAREKLKHRILILVGGRSFQVDPSLYVKIGADATATTAWESVETARKLEEKS